jgi:hypothetical protein
MDHVEEDGRKPISFHFFFTGVMDGAGLKKKWR